MTVAVSRVSTKSQTVIPRAVRDKLGLKPGDVLRYRITDQGILIEKVVEGDDPFATFTEWASEADDKAYADL